MSNSLSERSMSLKINWESEVFLISSESSDQEVQDTSVPSKNSKHEQDGTNENKEVEEEVTLPDDVWQDTFDRLLHDRQLLREQNIIKRNVRASFNMNSSYENSIQILNCSNSSNSDNSYYLLVPELAKELRKEKLKRRHKGVQLISTPLNKALYPFKCGISPIDCAKLKNWNKNSGNIERDNIKYIGLIATPINAKRSQKCVNYTEANNTILKELSPGHRKELMIKLGLPMVESTMNISSFAARKEAILCKESSIGCIDDIHKGIDKSLREKNNRISLEKNSYILSTFSNSDITAPKKETLFIENDDHVLSAEYSILAENKESLLIKIFDNSKFSSLDDNSVEYNDVPPENIANIPSIEINPIPIENNVLLEDKMSHILCEKNAVTFKNTDNMLVGNRETMPEVCRDFSTDGNNPSFKESSNLLTQSNNVLIDNRISVSTKTVPKKASKRSIRWLIESLKTDNVTENSAPLNAISNSDDDWGKLICLKPGKWHKSLHQWRHRNTIVHKQLEITSTQLDDHNDVEKKLYRGSLKRRATSGYGQRKSVYLPDCADEEVRKFSLRLTRSRLSRTNLLNCKDEILKICRQRKIQPFEKVYDDHFCAKCRKIGEGTYGEVFLHSAESIKDDLVLKIIPVEGDYLINDESQKTLDEILSEVIISTELSSLHEVHRGRKRIYSNFTIGFVKVNKVKYVIGKYPLTLLKSWEEYDDIKGSENEHPECFQKDQEFIVIELAYGGQDLETYLFKNAKQSYFALLQIIATLAVGENAFEFEHRDLHWGNILLQSTRESQICYKLDGEDFCVSSDGVQVTIIDYTLSRMMFQKNVHYNDLANDEELFKSTGDYQFDIYRMMKDHLKNKWEDYRPKTNIYWISYIIRKLINGVHYKKSNTKVHFEYLAKLRDLNETILSCESCIDWVRSCSNYNFHQNS